jgi:DNA-binding NarL/FixJ family response regulator
MSYCSVAANRSKLHGPFYQVAAAPVLDTRLMPNEHSADAIRVLLADDHDLVRYGLRSVLEFASDIVVVGEAATGAEALALIASLEPQVVLADMNMPPPDGIALAAELRSRAPNVRVLVLTMHEDVELAREALNAGAAGFVIKRASPTDLYEAVRVAARGEIYISGGLR